MDFWEISDEKLTIFIVELRTDHIHYLWVFSSCGKQQNFDPETRRNCEVINGQALKVELDFHSRIWIFSLDPRTCAVNQDHWRWQHQNHEIKELKFQNFWWGYQAKAP